MKSRTIGVDALLTADFAVVIHHFGVAIAKPGASGLNALP
jgi:hypothetical protein